MRSETTGGLLLAFPSLISGCFTLPMQRLPQSYGRLIEAGIWQERGFPCKTV
jgi:hypothetical protein